MECAASAPDQQKYIMWKHVPGLEVSWVLRDLGTLRAVMGLGLGTGCGAAIVNSTVSPRARVSVRASVVSTIEAASPTTLKMRLAPQGQHS